MEMMKMIKEAAAMRSKFAEMEKKLKAKTVEVEEKGVKVVINAKSEILDLKISPEVVSQGAEKTEKIVLSAIQKASKMAQDMMVAEAKSMSGGLKIPGLM